MNLKTQHYSKPIHSLIKRFIKPFPTDVNYIRRLDEEFKIIEEKKYGISKIIFTSYLE